MATTSSRRQSLETKQERLKHQCSEIISLEFPFTVKLHASNRIIVDDKERSSLSRLLLVIGIFPFLFVIDYK